VGQALPGADGQRAGRGGGRAGQRLLCGAAVAALPQDGLVELHGVLAGLLRLAGAAQIVLGAGDGGVDAGARLVQRQVGARGGDVPQQLPRGVEAAGIDVLGQAVEGVSLGLLLRPDALQQVIQGGGERVVQRAGWGYRPLAAGIEQGGFRPGVIAGAEARVRLRQQRPDVGHVADGEAAGGAGPVLGGHGLAAAGAGKRQRRAAGRAVGGGRVGQRPAARAAQAGLDRGGVGDDQGDL